MLIVGRAVAGLGAAGVFSGGLVIVGNLVVLRMRPCECLIRRRAHRQLLTYVPVWTGLLVSMFGLSNVVGPLIGAVFTEHVSWRWCKLSHKNEIL